MGGNSDFPELSPHVDATVVVLFGARTALCRVSKLRLTPLAVLSLRANGTNLRFHSCRGHLKSGVSRKTNFRRALFWSIFRSSPLRHFVVKPFPVRNLTRMRSNARKAATTPASVFAPEPTCQQFVAARLGFGLRFSSDHTLVIRKSADVFVHQIRAFKERQMGNAWLPCGRRLMSSSPPTLRTRLGSRRRQLLIKQTQKCALQTSSLASRCPFSMLSWSVASVFSKSTKKRRSQASPPKTCKNASKAQCDVVVKSAPLLFRLWLLFSDSEPPLAPLSSGDDLLCCAFPSGGRHPRSVQSKKRTLPDALTYLPPSGLAVRLDLLVVFSLTIPCMTWIGFQVAQLFTSSQTVES